MLSDIIARGKQKYPDHAALIFRDQPTTYGALAAGVEGLAAGLQALGIRPGERIALLLPNCPPFVLGYYAAARMGAVVVPANPLLKPPELEYIWRDADVRLVITAPPLLPGVQAARQNLPGLRYVVSIGEREEVSSAIPDLVTLAELMQEGARALAAEGAPEPPQDENACAVIIYTSGTTGHPKGAMLSHRNLTRNVEQVQAALHFDHHDRFLTVLPLFHSFAGTVCMNTALAAGCGSVLMESFAPARALEAIEKHKVTIFCGVPAMFNALLHFPPDRDYDLSGLRLFVSGGAPLPESTLTALEQRFGVPVLEGDGPTECSPVTSVNPLEGPRKAGSVGLPLPGVEIAIFDDEDRPLPADAVGEIVVRGDNVMLGYLNQPEATAEAMRSGWYHTGDLGRIDADGYVTIVDRKKDMIITAGLNVYPREVEEVLFAHPAVADAAVIGLPDALRGEEVTAVVVRKPETVVTERELIAFCRERLANYKVPRNVLFRESLPRGGTGKVVKRLLKKELENEIPDATAG
ncbi:MAG TPA: long-chain fatty acid--CoA ligase [Chthonomonadaceae bacterium]|nr:long-chain fatty acid--CoA ligase [Chthonomonadaceae bacterium]